MLEMFNFPEPVSYGGLVMSELAILSVNVKLDTLSSLFTLTAMCMGMTLGVFMEMHHDIIPECYGQV